MKNINYNSIITKIITNKNMYSTRKLKKNYNHYMFFESSKNIVDKFIHDLDDNQLKASRYLHKNVDLAFIDKIKTFQDFNYLNLEKFNIVNNSKKYKKIYLIFTDKENNKIIAHIKLMYSPDIYSKYKIIQFEFPDKFIIAKNYLL